MNELINRFRELQGFTWSLHWTPAETLESEEDYREFLNQSIPDLHSLVIYYPIVPGYLPRVEYGTPQSITPFQVMETIYQVYRQPFRQENANAIQQLTGQRITVTPEMSVLDLLGENVFFEGFELYKDGVTIKLWVLVRTRIAKCFFPDRVRKKTLRNASDSFEITVRTV